MQGLVLQNQPNLKLFNQLYWVITSAFMATLLAIFPLPHLIDGTFPAESRYYLHYKSILPKRYICKLVLTVFFPKSILIKLIP